MTAFQEVDLHDSFPKQTCTVRCNVLVKFCSHRVRNEHMLQFIELTAGVLNDWETSGAIVLFIDNPPL